MKGTVQNLNICGYECVLYLPQEYCMYDMQYPVIYINGLSNMQEIISCIESHFGVDCNPCILLSIQTRNWDDDYTPWPAPGLKKENKPFTGGASGYLCSLINVIKPFIDDYYKTKPEPENTALIGYSLGGLAALYALYTSGTFGRIGSLSGSLWYDGWLEFMGSNMPVNIDAKVYLSLGKVEEHSRNQRMAKVGNCTREAAEILTRQLTFAENLILEWNNGGHFTEISQRFERAIVWLMQDIYI